MTVQAKKFIAPGDIVAMRIDCRGCGASLSIPISSVIKVEKILGCSYCNEPWLRLTSGATADLAVRECLAGIYKLAGMLDGKQFPGFGLQLELREEPTVPAALM